MESFLTTIERRVLRNVKISPLQKKVDEINNNKIDCEKGLVSNKQNITNCQKVIPIKVDKFCDMV
jgi:hypothetical protein